MFGNRRNIIIALVVLALVLVGGYMLLKDNGGGAADKAKNLVTGQDGFSYDENTPGYETYKKLIQGCPFKDCIPSIDEPKFESINKADIWLEEQDIVFVLERGGEVKAYPQRILNWHEIANDEIAGENMAVTFCPLCGSALAFESTVDGKILEFGVSGKLHNNDLVMYDRQTESLWQQITGEAIVGEMKGSELVQVPLTGMRWSNFKEEFSEARVLSRDTGYSRDYTSSPYGNYESDESPLFPIEGGVDKTIHPKTVVYGVEIDGEAKAYEEETIMNEGEIRDSVGGKDVIIQYNRGDVTFVDSSGEEVSATRLFWFAWKAFHPGTELY